MTHYCVLTGIGFDLGVIQRHVPKAHHAGLLARPQDLNRETFEGIQVAVAEKAEPAVDRLLVTYEQPEAKTLKQACSILQDDSVPTQ